ncbi:ATP-binding protein [Paenibacillus sp. FSL R7-0210]|uniref:sensor histidine kinase n=1 Tax=Paenibacillus sp. FSL R7-0210 TaxID=2921676 RepID=UPI0030F98D5F
MKFNVFRSGASRSGNDLFARTQKRLTWRYSAVMSVFLLLSFLIIYLLLHLLIWNNQKERLHSLLDAEVKQLQGPMFDELLQGRDHGPGNQEFTLSADQSFYVILNTEGGLLGSGEIQPGLKEQVLKLADSGAAKTAEGLAIVVLEQGPGLLHKGNDPKDSPQAAYLLGSRVFEHKGQPAGILYAGKDVTFQQQLFRWLLGVLAAIAAVFILLAAVFSRVMSRQAMVPVREAYDRQKHFAADASHELRTPLSVMLSSIETLKLEDSINEQTFTRHVVDGMYSEVQRMTALTRDLLLLARSDAGLLEQVLRRFDLAPVLALTLSGLGVLAEAKQIRLTLEAPAELPVKQDQEKLVQLMVILLENAIKFTPAGGRVILRAALIQKNSSTWLALEVQDTGVGIPAEDLSRIFERFYRPDQSRSREAGGHGLGLAIAKELIDTLGGSIMAENCPGGGSVFRVELRS